MKALIPLIFSPLLLNAQTLTLDSLNDYPGGYRVDYTVTNDTSAASEGWLVTIQVPAGVAISNVSNADIVTSLSDVAAGTYALQNKSYNGSLAVGASTGFGFSADPDNDSTPPDSGVVTLDFDPNSLPLFQAVDTSIQEGDSGSQVVQVVVRLSQEVGEEATVDYRTVDGSAVNGADYSGQNGTLVFASGETEKMVEIGILGDLADEGDESFTLELSNGEGARIGTSTATVTIIENDIVPDLAVADASTFEGAGASLEFTVTLTPAASEVVTVSYATGGGTATEGSDYTGRSGVLTFNPGETSQAVEIAVLDDSLEELPESFQFNLSNQSNADLGRAIATGRILDDELTGNGKPETGPFNYAEVLQKSMYFYEAQRSGALPEDNRVAWRADSALDDGADVGRDLSGGWYDAGDHVKFNFPMAFSATTLAWGGIEFQEGYLETGQYPYLLENLRWVCDYLLKCHEVDAEGKTTTLWGQVASGGVDHSYWGASEVYPLERPSFKIDRDNPGTDLACETAAALASCSILFRSTDPQYADELLENARAVYEFGDTYRGIYSESITDAAAFYRSFSGFKDELLWGALWLYAATNEQAYLDRAYAEYTERFPVGSDASMLDFGPNWDDKIYACLVLMAGMLNEDPANEADADPANDDSAIQGITIEWFNKWIDGGVNSSFVITPGGLRWLQPWGSLRYTANTSMLALLYAKTVGDPDGRLFEFGESQINYILGDNPQDVSYVIGFGDDFPTHPHHRGAHGGWRNNGPEIVDGSQFPSRNILFGGLVGGPIRPTDDSWIDWRFDRDGSPQAFQANEVATDYNAGFTGAIARMYELQGGSPLSDFPPEVEIPAGTEFFVSASLIENTERTTDIRFVVNNRSYSPAREGQGLSFRYYFDLSELYANGLTASDVEVASRSGGGSTQFSAILPHDEENRIYYVEITLVGQNPLPIERSRSRVELQIRLGLPNGSPAAAWNPANDFSYRNISTAVGIEGVTYTGFIPTYQNGVLVDGLLPDGDEVIVSPPFEQWVQASFTAAEASNASISGPLADPDGDGHLNIVEYALGLNPKVGDPGEVLSSEVDVDSQRMILSYPSNSEATDVSVEIEGSPNLRSNSWNRLQATELPSADPGERVFGDNLNANNPHYFYRLRVVRD